MPSGEQIISRLRESQDLDSFRQQHWTGSFAEYLDLVREQPRVTRSAFERLYDMILSYGTSEYVDNKKSITP